MALRKSVLEEVAGTRTTGDDRPSMTGTYYEFLEQCRLDNNFGRYDRTAYSPTSLVPEPPRALNPANVHVRVAERHVGKE